MISEERIDELIKPIVDAQAEYSLFILRTIANRVKQIGRLSYNEASNLVRQLLVGEDIAKIQQEFSKLTRIQLDKIRKLVLTITEELYKEAEPLYIYRDIKQPHLYGNKEVIDIAFMMIASIEDDYLDFIQDGVFILRDLKTPNYRMPQSITRTYQSVLNEALNLRHDTTIDFNTEMARTLGQLVDSGLRRISTNKDGFATSARISNILRTELLEKVKELNIKMQDAMSKQYGSDGIEISAHANSAPDHEPVQGRQFENAEFDKLQSNMPFHDANSNQYVAIRRPIGAWNCRHWIKSIIIGFSRPEYTEKELKQMEEANAKGYTLPNGKHYTLYECTQRQRTYERNIRNCRDGVMIAKTAGNTVLEEKYKAQYVRYVNEYKAFSKACGLYHKL